MKFFNRYISSKIILKIFLGLAVAGMVLILLSVNRMNSILNTDLGFDKDSVMSIRTEDSKIVLPDSLVFSSVLPGFKSQDEVVVKSEFARKDIKIALQYVSDSYFDFFNCEKLNEKLNLFMDHGNAQLIYINESAVDELGIYNIDDAPGTVIGDLNNNKLIICGVIKEFESLNLNTKQQAKIYQLTSDHLTYAFATNSDANLLINVDDKIIGEAAIISFQTRIHDYYKLWEDVIYSTFLFINIMILLICLGHIGTKYAYKKDGELFKVLSVGIHALTIVISKTYIYLLAIIVFVVGPLAFLIQSLWLSVYENRVNFGLIDLIIILSMALLTTYLVCCPKKRFEDQLKGKNIHFKSI